MLSNTTHGTFNDSIIFLATVVFPEALPPQTPKYSVVNNLSVILYLLLQKNQTFVSNKSSTTN